MVVFHQNEDHDKEEVTPPHPSIVGRHNHSSQHAVDIQRELDVTDWIDKDKNDVSDCDAEGREEDMSELTKSIPEWMPNDARRSQLLHYFQDFVRHT